MVAHARLRPDSTDPRAAAVDEARYERLFAIGLWVAVAGAVLQGVGHLVNVFAFDGDSWNLDAEADNNGWAWASSVATFTCAFILVVLATLRRGPTRHLWFLALVLAFFSVDDLIKVHEQVGTRFRDDVLGLPTGWGRLAWPAIFFPLLAAVFVLLWRLSREATPRAGRWIRAGLGMLVAAVALELASAPWYISGRSAHSVPGALEVVVEEGLELAAWIAIATALTVVLLESVKVSE